MPIYEVDDGNRIWSTSTVNSGGWPHEAQLASLQLMFGPLILMTERPGYFKLKRRKAVVIFIKD